MTRGRPPFICRVGSMGGRMECRGMTKICQCPGPSTNRGARYDCMQPGVANEALCTAFFQMTGECRSDTSPAWRQLHQDKLASLLGSEQTMKLKHVWAAARSPHRGPCSYTAGGSRDGVMAACPCLSMAGSPCRGSCSYVAAG
eukprot:jgi/Botrbrau1/14032/Bobra.0310s0017.1